MHEEKEAYEEMREMNDGPRHAGRTGEDGEDNEPREEQYKDVGAPDAGVGKPFGVPVQIRRRRRPNVQIRHIPLPIPLESTPLHSTQINTFVYLFLIIDDWIYKLRVQRN